MFRVEPSFQRGAESMHHNPVWTRIKISAYSVSVALRASIVLRSQPGASSVPEAEENIRNNSRADIKVRGHSSGESSVALES